MRMESIGMDEYRMVEQVKTTIAKLVAGFESIFGRRVGPHDISYVCVNQDCQWWDDSLNNILAREILVPKPDANGGIDPSGMNTAVALCCPECKFRVKAIASHIWIKKANPRQLRQKGSKLQIHMPAGYPN